MSSITNRSLAENRSLYAPEGGQKRLDADMGHLLRRLEALDPRPFDTLSVGEARVQPTLAKVLRSLLREGAESMGVGLELRMVPGPGGDIPLRLYTPPVPVPDNRCIVLYLHGGGFVVGDLPTNDAAPRALCRRLGAMVVAPLYRLAPENVFPAAHEDTLAVWTWLVANAASLGGTAALLALVGDGSGGNLAVNLALDARDGGLPRPRHLALISPMVGTDSGLSSYAENRATLPLRSATVEWFWSKYARDAADLKSPQLNLIDRTDLGKLPATTIILPELDPLRSEGEQFAQALRRSGVWVDSLVYDGVTHGFFDLPQAVNKAMFAHAQVTRNIRASLDAS